MPCYTGYSSGQQAGAADYDNVGAVANEYVRVATVGTETFTISSGSVTTINGTTVDGVTIAVGDRILVLNAPSASGTGTTIPSSQPANGLYVCTANTTNLSVSRANDMSSNPGTGSTGTAQNPSGAAVNVMVGTVWGLSTWMVSSPSSPTGAFTYGTTAVSWSQLPAARDLLGFTPPFATGWTQLNLGSPTAFRNTRVLSVSATSGDKWVGETRTLSPSSNYTAVFNLDYALPPTNYASAGIILINGSSQCFTYDVSYSNGFVVVAAYWNSSTSFNNTASTWVGSAFTSVFPNWLRIRDDGTNINFEHSNNGLDWVTQYSQVRTFGSGVATSIGWAINANNSGGSYSATARLRSLSGIS